MDLFFQVSSNITFFLISTDLSSTEQETQSQSQTQPLHDQEQQLSQFNDFSNSQFWEAYDALSNHQKATFLFQQGVERAKFLQMEIVNQAKEIILKKEISQSGAVRYCILSDTTHLNSFLHPLSLSSLAHFLVDTLIVCLL